MEGMLPLLKTDGGERMLKKQKASTSEKATERKNFEKAVVLPVLLETATEGKNVEKAGVLPLLKN